MSVIIKISLRFQLVLAAVFFFTMSVSTSTAAGNKLAFTLPSGLPSGLTLLIVGKNGKADSRRITSRKVSVSLPDSSARVYILRDGQVAYQVVSKVCNSLGGRCTRTNKVNTLFRRNASLGSLRLRNGHALLASVSGSRYAAHAHKAGIADALRYVPVGLPSLGLEQASVSNLRLRSLRATLDSTDRDADGMVNAVDADDDGDGTLDNYDASTPSSSNTFRIFSNLKLELDQSLNLHTTGLDTSRIDTALSSTQTLAIEVGTETGETAELDCGTLSYCASGGTGESNNQDFPGILGGGFDADSDGLGTIERGGTGDFQLRTNATSATIAAGDTLIQRIDPVSGSEREEAGMLNFVFMSTPALKSIAINADPAVDLNYASTPILASRQDCLDVPATGDVALTLTAFRPQRPGVSEAGEAEYMDIGNSLITIDVPNSPVESLSGPGGGAGPGNCSNGSYSESDEHLTLTENGLQDSLGDQTASSSQTVTFTIDVTACLNNASTPVAWNAGEYLFLDLQFRSQDGDNAAQKFCIRRLPIS